MSDSNNSGGWAIGCGAAVVALLVVLGLMALSGAEVGAGYVGVVGSWGSVDKNQTPLAPGFHFVFPVATHIDSISTQPQNHQFREVAAASKELQNVYVDGGVNYVIDSKHAAEIVIEGGLDAVIAKVFDPAFQDYMKEVVPAYSSVDILSHRTEIRDAVKSRLSDKAGAYGITVVDVFVTNIHFDPGYTKAIEAAAEAQQSLAKAKVDAESIKVQAQAEADANRIRQQSITPQLIQYQAVQKWNGVLPLATGGEVPFINVKP